MLVTVSVLFSEPKIPQSQHAAPRSKKRTCFSALQRAENSSIDVLTQASQRGRHRFSALQRAENSSIFSAIAFASNSFRFQCSSASRKFLNRQRTRGGNGQQRSFSALQRAENSSIEGKHRRAYGLYAFQCSSASRKFLNSSQHYNVLARSISVSVDIIKI